MLDRERERQSVVTDQSNIMGNGHSAVLMGARDVDLTEKLDYSSAMALISFSHIIAILRAFNVKDEATRVMISTLLIAFITTHILYLNFYQLDYGLNMKVCVAICVFQLLLWALWAGVTRHPSRWKLWVVVVGGGLAMLLEILDFPLYQELIDAYAFWHAAMIPLAFLWWSFIRDDAEFRTSSLIKKAKWLVLILGNSSTMFSLTCTSGQVTCADIGQFINHVLSHMHVSMKLMEVDPFFVF